MDPYKDEDTSSSTTDGYTEPRRNNDRETQKQVTSSALLNDLLSQALEQQSQINDLFAKLTDVNKEVRTDIDEFCDLYEKSIMFNTNNNITNDDMDNERTHASMNSSREEIN
ncbi:uncharacterized protein NDAI_0G02410 [Naumovozyma dairenensis CBS 421]|uniref:Uncharacterized protein n=1 Tax=Naumovozyma dairenensis (strain ATCC 10597 / BCRC 20456 / CBS 421 / NBRC 0211 / NRRL Y-12639) TaxID=1071378 RepID=G0WE05_NAUDC|nr:hypothetical protein NDAI_0G02410 [Naumovozyma dairenensis CBS 421]CCD26016.2 hypothetical protein NDAI_0G02410 [Naumovozyma dairenensis CBS 421]